MHHRVIGSESRHMAMDPICVKPWELSHANGGVEILQDALDEKHDGVRAKMPTVKFGQCK